MRNVIRRVYPPRSTFLVFCTCHRGNAGRNTATVPGLVREGWFTIR